MEMREEIKRKLIEEALQARKFSYAPYSGFYVGAALLSESGMIYQGCNIENASYGATNCAERTAFFKAVSSGDYSFQAIAIAGGKTSDAADEYAYPCGICRQVMKEFCKNDFIILVAKNINDYHEYTLEELLPCGFGGDVLQ